MEPAVARVVVFAAAIGAHGERRHGGALPIVGRTGHDGEARAAVCAVEEGIAVTAIAGIVQLAQAVGAGGDIRRDERGPAGAGFARVDTEAGLAARLALFAGQFLDPRQRRRPPPQLADESIERVRSALYLDDHSAGAISHETRESQARGERVHVRAKAHTLHHASDGDAPARR